MAPFGKNFLKARLKNRTKDAEPSVGKEIQVSVCSEEKVVCGVTKHTTCADMIQALLDDHKAIPESKRLLHGEPKDFCLVERWKGFERALPPLTRILRLWSAWGDQRPFVHFVLLKTSDFISQSARKAGKSKGARPKRWEHGRSPQSLPVEKQKRVVRKAFRKLEKLHKENRNPPGTQEVDRMVQLILDQDHTIREQIQHMRELDLEIEQFQAQSESAATPAHFGVWGLEAQSEEQLQEYLYASDGVEELELQVQRHQDLIRHLSREIDAELRKDAEDEDEESDGAAAAVAALWSPSEAGEPVCGAELEKLQSQLKLSLITGVSLHNQVAEVDKQLRYFDATLVSKDQECWRLAAQLNSLQVTDGAEDEPGPPKNESVPQTVKLKHSQSPLDATDTDSDTGISSTHSQDSLSPCLDFPPPLDTDV